MIERFSKQEFEAQLPKDKNTGSPLWTGPEMVKGELVYTIEVTGTNKRLRVRSSVDGSGFAAETGEDSIRIWAEYWYKNNWRAMAKVDAWTTRQPGWETRMVTKLRELYQLAIDDSKRFAKPVVSPAEQMAQAMGIKPATITTQTAFAPSGYQQRIMDAVLNTTDNLQVVACPGSGKSTTLKWIATEAEKAGQEGLAILTFAKALQVEMAEKMTAVGSSVPVQTCHSLGFSNNKRAYPYSRMQANKTMIHLKTLLDTEYPDRYSPDREVIWSNRWSVISLVEHLRYQLAEPTTENMERLSARFGIDTNGDQQAVFRFTRRIYARVIEDTKTFDFVDMIFWTASGKVAPSQVGTLFIDESQDFNPAMIEFTLKTLGNTGRAIVVGDPNQSIYGFMGADSQAMSRFQTALNATELPLSICYRCDRAIVAHASEIFPNIEARPDAAEGLVSYIQAAQLTAMVTAGDLVLCRTNAPMVRACYDTIRAGKKAFIVGRDIASGLVKLIDRIVEKNKLTGIIELAEALQDYRNAEAAKLEAADKPMAAQAVEDKVDTIIELMDGVYTIEELKERIDSIFDDSDDKAAIRFSTVHRAKGTEADRVFILKPELMPFPKATSEEDIQQEQNIIWVARTRAKHELYYVISR